MSTPTNSSSDSQKTGDTIRTERLLLRPWRREDREANARMNADPAVTEFLPKRLTREESDALADRIEAHFARHGWGLFAAEWQGEFIGWIGLNTPPFEAHFTPCVEIGWRLLPHSWGRGLATEGAKAVLRYAFEKLTLEEVVAFTVPANLRSQRVMEKIGMAQDLHGDFDHPLVPDHHPLKRHVLYRIHKSAFNPSFPREAAY